MNRFKFSILYAEDDEEDRLIFQEAVSEASMNVGIIQTENGDQLLKYLAGVEAANLPCAIISDLQMPLKNGLDVLEELKKDARWQHIPFVLFSTSSSKADMDRAMRLGAAAYYSKPQTFQETISIIRTIVETCLQVNRTSRHYSQD